MVDKLPTSTGERWISEPSTVVQDFFEIQTGIYIHRNPMVTPPNATA